MSNHQPFANLATRLIDEHGRDVGLVEITNSGTEWNPAQTESVTTVKAVNVQFSKLEMFNGLAEEGDRRYLIDSSVTPDTSMLIRDGADLSIIDVDQIKPGDQSILYRVHARA